MNMCYRINSGFELVEEKSLTFNIGKIEIEIKIINTKKQQSNKN